MRLLLHAPPQRLKHLCGLQSVYRRGFDEVHRCWKSILHIFAKLPVSLF
jgi:hypothetical protein